MKNLIPLIVLLTIVPLFGNLFAQKTSLENVATVHVHNIAPIYKGAEVMGYYVFYRTDKIDKKTYSYELSVLDQNLNKVSTNTISGSIQLTLVESVFNADGLVLKFYDAKSGEVNLQTYNLQAQLIKEEKWKAGIYEIGFYQVIAQGGYSRSYSLYPIEHAGIIDIKLVNQNSIGYGYEQSFFPTNENFKKWTVASNPKSKDLEALSFLYGDQNIILNVISKQPGIMSKKMDFEVMATSTKTGEIIFKNKLEDPKYELMVRNGFVNKEGNILLFGTYFNKGDKELKSESLGIFLILLDKNGLPVLKKFLSWEQDIRNLLPGDKKKKSDSVESIFFQGFIETSDGKIYVIGQQFDEQASTSTVLKDLVYMEFDKTFMLKSVSIIEKEKTIIGDGNNSSESLNYLIKSMGFIQTNADNSIIITLYLNKVKIGDANNKYVLGAVTLIDGNITEDKIDIAEESKDNTIWLLPAKLGNIVVVEYNKEKKSLNLRMEKINY